MESWFLTFLFFKFNFNLYNEFICCLIKFILHYFSFFLFNSEIISGEGTFL